MHYKKMTRFVHTVKKTENQKMPYFSNEKRYRKNSKGFELQEPRGTVGEFFTKMRDKK